MSLHAISLILHALNCAIVSSVAARFVRPGAALVAGLVMALFPASVEAVGWAAGIFDLMSAFAVLVTLTLWLMPTLSMRAEVGCVIAVAVGLCAKETAVVAPALLLGAGAVLPGRTTVRHKRCAMAVAGVCSAYIVARLLSSHELAGHVMRAPTSRMAVKDFLVRPFSGLLVPFRTDSEVSLMAWCAAIAALAIMTWLLVMSVTRRNAKDAAPGFAIYGILWVSACAAPLLSQFFVASNLEGSRYLYMPSVGWAWLVAASVGARQRVMRWVTYGLVAILCGSYLGGLLSERTVWTAATVLRDEILVLARDRAISANCGPITIADAPGDFRGVYVFRQGLDQALVSLPVNSLAEPCQLSWTGTDLIAIPPPR